MSKPIATTIWLVFLLATSSFLNFVQYHAVFDFEQKETNTAKLGLDHFKTYQDKNTLNRGNWSEEVERIPDQHRCAFCFFGLPRSYRVMVLPSIVQNILIPNARYNCDIFVHYFDQEEEQAGRMNRGGTIDSTEIFLLENAAKDIASKYHPVAGNSPQRPSPHVGFTSDTEAQFLQKRGRALQKFHNTVGPDGKPVYYPWNRPEWTKSSLDNVVKQWHSIQSSFELMEDYANNANVTYNRVGMFRSDSMYLTPINIAMLDRNFVDSENHYAVVGPFGRHPVNDRMVYGPYEAVKIWSTKRFDLIEERANDKRHEGNVMHSEEFLHGSIFPAIESLGFEKHVNEDICFIRTRADNSAIISDCERGGHTRDWEGVDKQALVERISQQKCSPPGVRKCTGCNRKWRFIDCQEKIEDAQ